MAVKMRVDGADLIRKVVKPFSLAPEQIRKAERSAINEALKSTRSKGKKMAAEEYAIKAAGKKTLETAIMTAAKRGYDEEGTLRFVGDVGTKLRYFPAKPAKIPARWLKKLGADGKTVVRKGLNPRLRQPVGGTFFRLKKRGGYALKQGPQGQSTFWYYAPWINLPKHKGRKRSDALRIGYRTVKTGGQMSEWGLFGPSLIQAVGRRDILKALVMHAQLRYAIRLEHQFDVRMRGILK